MQHFRDSEFRQIRLPGEGNPFGQLFKGDDSQGPKVGFQSSSMFVDAGTRMPARLVYLQPHLCGETGETSRSFNPSTLRVCAGAFYSSSSARCRYFHPPDTRHNSPSDMEV